MVREKRDISILHSLWNLIVEKFFSRDIASLCRWCLYGIGGSEGAQICGVWADIVIYWYESKLHCYTGDGENRFHFVYCISELL